MPNGKGPRLILIESNATQLMQACDSDSLYNDLIMRL